MRRIVIALVVAACSSAPPVHAPRHAASADSIDRLAAEMLRTTPAAGISVTVVSHGETIVAKGYGLADVDRKAPVTAATVFRIGSITKQFAAAAILQLASAHRLSLDDELTRYLPDYPTQGKHITLRHLLTHTSGVHDYEHGPWFVAHMAERRPAAELVASFAAEPLDFDPGARWSYSNSGYYLLGEIVEKVSKQSFADYVRDHLLAPAGVRGIRYCPDDQSYPDAAHGYDAARAPARPINMVYAFSAGALCATSPGLVAWSRALAGGHVVDAAAWRAMTTPVTLADGSQYRYGFGLFVADLDGHRAIFHGGGVNGFVATLAYYPDDDLYIAVLVNTEGSFADDLGEAIARAVLHLPKRATVDLPIDPAEAAAIAGSYEITGLPAPLVLGVEDGKLLVIGSTPAERLRLLRQADGSFLVEGSDLRIVVVREGARVTKLEIHQAGVVLEGARR